MKDEATSFDYKSNETLYFETFKQLAKVLPHGIVRGAGRKITPMNLYEAVSVGAALTLKQKQALRTKGLSTWIASADLKRLTTGATNNKATVAGRIEFCRDRFLGK
jgi:hypothetical protein